MEEVASIEPGSIAYRNNHSSRKTASLSNLTYGNATTSAAGPNPDSLPDGAPILAISGAHIEDLVSSDTLSKPPLYKRRWFIIVSMIGNCIGIAFMFIMLFPVVKAIIQDIVNKTVIDITMMSITNPGDISFQLLMQGTVTRTGTFSATITFPTPMNVNWLDGSTKAPLGYMQLSTLHARNNQATINDTTTFYVTDQQAFGRFISTMNGSQNFTWQLENYDLTVQAEKFPTAHGISFNKLVTVNGMDNFGGNIQLGGLQFLGDNPANVRSRSNLEL